MRTSRQSPRILTKTKTPATRRCAVVYLSTPSMIGLSLACFSVCGFLKSFGDVIEQLNGTNVRSLSNTTMRSDVHEWFTRLESGSKRRYSITPTPPYPTQSHPHPGPLRNPIHLSLPPRITSTTPDNENLPAPSESCTQSVPRSPSFLGH